MRNAYELAKEDLASDHGSLSLEQRAELVEPLVYEVERLREEVKRLNQVDQNRYATRLHERTALQSLEERLKAEELLNRALLEAATGVLREALDRVEVHPCDENNDQVRAHGLSEEMKVLFMAIDTAKVEGDR